MFFISVQFVIHDHPACHQHSPPPPYPLTMIQQSFVYTLRTPVIDFPVPFLFSTAVVDFLAQPPPEAPAPTEATTESFANADAENWQGSDDSSCEDYSEDELVAPPRAGGGFPTTTAAAPSRYSRSGQRHFAAGNNDVGPGGGGSFAPKDDDPKAAGEAVAGAALAADYGAWLKRLAVRLRRATPAGDRFVRLRRIGPTVTGEQVRESTYANESTCLCVMFVSSLKLCDGTVLV